MKYFYTLLLVSFFSLATHAQVTIGVSEEPISGALLQLKDKPAAPNGVPNADKGLGLPRLHLSNVTMLYPMFETSSGSGTPTDQYDTQPERDAENARHTGLLAYNINQCFLEGDGLYVWDGKKWVSLTESNCKSVTDFEGNTYTAKRFGCHCWMTQNLRSTKDRNGVDLSAGVRINPGYVQETNAGISTNQAAWIQSTDMIPDPINMTQKAFAEKFGVMYTWDTATTICPAGWHLAKESDWDKLTLNTLGGQGVAGKKMKADDARYFHRNTAASTKFYDWGGHPVGHPDNSGFNAYPSGYVDPFFTTATDFSASASWWSALSRDATTAYSKYLVAGTGITSITFTSGSKTAYKAVRCVRD